MFPVEGRMLGVLAALAVAFATVMLSQLFDVSGSPEPDSLAALAGDTRTEGAPTIAIQQRELAAATPEARASLQGSLAELVDLGVGVCPSGTELTGSSQTTDAHTGCR